MNARRARLRLVSWNVRHCLGLDLRIVPERIARVLAALDADIVALQELDVGQPRTRGVDQPGMLADILRMSQVFCRTVQCGIGQYGHALLSRIPLHEVERVELPGLPATEPRAALRARVPIDGGHVSVVATHLGLRGMDRAMQTRALRERLVAGEPTVLLGDLNAGPGQIGYDELAADLADPFAPLPTRARSTWPAPWPVRPLDHALCGPQIAVGARRIVGHGAARFASDHRPVLIEIALE